MLIIYLNILTAQTAAGHILKSFKVLLNSKDISSMWDFSDMDFTLNNTI